MCAVGADNSEIGETITVEDLRRLPCLASSAGPLRSIIEDELEN